MASNHSKHTLPNKGVPNAGILYGIDPNTEALAHAIRVDATGALIVSSTAGAGAASTLTTEISYYVAMADDSNGTDYLDGDVLKVIDVIDMATGTVNSTTWVNVTQNKSIGVPAGSEIAIQGGSALTDAELRAAPVEVDQVSTERQVSFTRIQYQNATIAAGNLEVSIAVESGYAYIQGTYSPAGYSYLIRANDQDTLGAITCDASAGTVLIMEIV